MLRVQGRKENWGWKDTIMDIKRRKNIFICKWEENSIESESEPGSVEGWVM